MVHETGSNPGSLSIKCNENLFQVKMSTVVPLFDVADQDPNRIIRTSNEAESTWCIERVLKACERGAERPLVIPWLGVEHLNVEPGSRGQIMLLE